MVVARPMLDAWEIFTEVHTMLSRLVSNVQSDDCVAMCSPRRVLAGLRLCSGILRCQQRYAAGSADRSSVVLGGVDR